MEVLCLIIFFLLVVTGLCFIVHSLECQSDFSEPAFVLEMGKMSKAELGEYKIKLDYILHTYNELITKIDIELTTGRNSLKTENNLICQKNRFVNLCRMIRKKVSIVDKELADRQLGKPLK